MKLLVSLCAVAMLSACTSSTRKQREYVDAIYLADSTPPVAQEEVREGNRTTRYLNERSFDLSVKPVTTGTYDALIKDIAFKENRSVKKVRAEYSRLRTMLASQSCFDVSNQSEGSEEAANLKYVYLTLETPSATLKLYRVGSQKSPRASSHVGSYSTGGYGYSIGDTYYYTPSQTQVYSYSVHSMSDWYCAPRKVDLTKGFTIYVDARVQPNLPIHDLVWSTDPQDLVTFRDGVGVPISYGGGPGEWAKERYAQNWKKIRKSDPPGQQAE